MMKETLPSLESLATIRSDGSRKFIHPATARGRFTKWRTVVGLLLMVAYVALPWIPINGQPAVFLDVLHRRFHLFGLTFAPQDVWLAFFLITGVGFSLFFITALLGRVWCGWGCPQTVFLDIVRRIDTFFEGDGAARNAMSKRKLTSAESTRRVMKNLTVGLFALLIAHVFLSYFVSIPGLWKMMHESPREHWAAFVIVFGMAGALWFDFVWFREQFCIVLCPYGRLQSALVDTDTLVIGYDQKRGEPRGKRREGEVGDCVDCRRCVQVCPTGIDIRQGLQIECIGCAACVDACDTVMDKLERKRGLVRYDSQNGFAQKPRKIVRPRIILYLVLLALGMTAATVAVTRYRPVSVSVIRMIGAPYYVESGNVRNNFSLRVINKRHEPVHYKVEFVGAPRELKTAGVDDGITIPAYGEQTVPLVMMLPRSTAPGSVPLTLRLRDAAGKVIVEQTFPFLGPG